jgi:hypothetical protein
VLVEHADDETARTLSACEPVAFTMTGMSAFEEQLKNITPRAPSDPASPNPPGRIKF